MANKHDVLRVFDANPDWSSAEIAKALNCHPAYVRCTLKRNDRQLVRTCAGHKKQRGEGARIIDQEWWRLFPWNLPRLGSDNKPLKR